MLYKSDGVEDHLVDSLCVLFERVFCWFLDELVGESRVQVSLSLSLLRLKRSPGSLLANTLKP